jgi:hypothetical protein
MKNQGQTYSTDPVAVGFSLKPALFVLSLRKSLISGLFRPIPA